MRCNIMTNSPEKTGGFHYLPLPLRKIIMKGAPKRFLASLVHVCLLERANLYWLIPVSCVTLFVSVWLMLSPGLIYSKYMTWDLLFNLEGAWQVYTGQVAHIDFHTPNGTLNFAITALGFEIIGVKPLAFVVGECILAVAITLLAILTVKDRLPFLPGIVFVSMCVGLILVPVTVGDEPTAFT